MSNPNQVDAQQVYVQYQNAVRQLQIFEQQEAIYSNLLEQYRSNLDTLEGLRDYPDDGEIVIPISDMIYLKASLIGIKEVIVDIGSDLLLPTTIDDALSKLKERISQVDELVQRFSKQKSELETIATGLQSQLNQISGR